MPHLLDIQRNSYQWFLDEGLQDIFNDISPIQDFSGNLVLSFESFSLGEPKYELDECKERDVTGEDKTLPTYQHRARLRMDYEKGHWQVRSTLDFNQFQQLYYHPSRGFAFTQMLHYQQDDLWQFTLQGSYFHTDDYDSRVYAYERGLLNTFYSPSFYGEGFRFSAHFRWDLNEHFMFLGKLGYTHYLDREEIGSGNDLIRSNHKTDLQLQLRWKF